ncbi:MAG: hypothetical protein R3256_06440 [Thalassovita sp.]|nr:hypothetical protein [Thalassovita sp.]
MIHVMNPFQLSVAMFRLTSVGMECQVQMMKALTAMAMAPMKAAMQSETEEDGEAATKTEAAPAGSGRAAKPAVRRSHGALKAGTAKKRRPRKPSTPPEMPEAVGKTVAVEEDGVVESVPV